jgi:hypothetical protein
MSSTLWSLLYSQESMYQDLEQCIDVLARQETPYVPLFDSITHHINSTTQHHTTRYRLSHKSGGEEDKITKHAHATGTGQKSHLAPETRNGQLPGSTSRPPPPAFKDPSVERRAREASPSYMPS